MASSSEGYWSRSWALLTRDKGWFKPVLVLAAARLVPIVGGFGADGYALEWARLTSWGVDSAPKQKGVDIGACIATGARAFVVALGYGMILVMAQGILTAVLGETLGGTLGLIVSFFGAVLILVAQLRSAIYQTISAGYQMNRVADMVQRDFAGLARVAGLSAVMGLVVGIAASLLLGAVFMANMGAFLLDYAVSNRYGYDEVEVAGEVLRSMATAAPALCVMVYLINVLSTIANLVMTTSVGLWMRQFDVSNWGESSDPLPGNPTGSAAAGTPYAAPTTPNSAYTHVPTQPGTDAYAATSQAEAPYGTTPHPTASAAQAPSEAAWTAAGATEAPQPEKAQDFAAKEPAWEGTKAVETVEPQEPAVDDALVSDIPIVPIAGYQAEGATDEPAAEEVAAEEPTPEDKEGEVPETIFLRDFDEAREPAASEVSTFTLDEVYGEDEPTAAAVEDEQAVDEDVAERDASDEELDKMLNAVKQASIDKEQAEVADTSTEAPATSETEDGIIAEMEKAIREATVEDDEADAAE